MYHFIHRGKLSMNVMSVRLEGVGGKAFTTEGAYRVDDFPRTTKKAME